MLIKKGRPGFGPTAVRALKAIVDKSSAIGDNGPVERFERLAEIHEIAKEALLRGGIMWDYASRSKENRGG